MYELKIIDGEIYEVVKNAISLVYNKKSKKNEETVIPQHCHLLQLGFEILDNDLVRKKNKNEADNISIQHMLLYTANKIQKNTNMLMLQLIVFSALFIIFLIKFF